MTESRDHEPSADGPGWPKDGGRSFAAGGWAPMEGFRSSHPERRLRFRTIRALMILLALAPFVVLIVLALT